MTSAEFERIVGLAQAGDADALEAVLSAAAGVAAPVVRQIAGAEWEDVLQGVLWTVARKLAWLDEPRAFRAWVYRIATRAAVRHAARERRVWPFARREDPEAVPDDGGHLDPPLLDQIPRLLDRLTARSRAVIVLHYLEELPLDEVAAVLGTPVGTVKSRLSYGLRLMRQAVGKNQ